jgi:glyoxylase I family protein
MADIAPKGLEHLAYLTWDTAATVKFYEEVLGMPLVHAIVDDKVESAGITGIRFLHTFFDMGGGSQLGFIEIEGLPAETPDPNMPDWPRHIAIKVDSLEALEARRQDLLAKGVAVTDIHGHGPHSRSIYLFDPNGVRLEFCYAVRSGDPSSVRRAHEVVDKALQDFRQSAQVPAGR